MFAGNFAPWGWLFCSGQLLPISEYETLFNLIGTTYGGDGQTTFALPDFRGRIPIHSGQGTGLTNRIIGESGGAESVTLTAQQMPGHRHAHVASASAATNAGDPTGLTANAGTTLIYGPDTPSVALNAAAVGSAGGSQPHDNMAPYLALNFIISAFGIFPSPA
jgi:microcystin-dependent protein